MAVRAVVAPKDFADDVVFYILNVINFLYNNNLKYRNDAQFDPSSSRSSSKKLSTAAP